MLSLNHYTVSLGFLGLYDRKNSYLRIYIYSHSLSDILSLFSQCDSMTVSQKKAFITLSLTCEYLSWFFFFLLSILDDTLMQWCLSAFSAGLFVFRDHFLHCSSKFLSRGTFFLADEVLPSTIIMAQERSSLAS